MTKNIDLAQKSDTETRKRPKEHFLWKTGVEFWERRESFEFSS